MGNHDNDADIDDDDIDIYINDIDIDAIDDSKDRCDNDDNNSYYYGDIRLITSIIASHITGVRWVCKLFFALLKTRFESIFSAITKITSNTGF